MVGVVSVVLAAVVVGRCLGGLGDLVRGAFGGLLLHHGQGDSREHDRPVGGGSWS